jgi:hyperosmotically inducible protein
MTRKPSAAGKPFSNILPGVVAAFAGAVLVVACDSSDPRANTAENVARTPPQAGSGPAPVPAAEAPVGGAAQPRSLPSRVAISDTVITGRIKTALLGDPGMAGADVSVNTDRGVVTLAGNVKSHEQSGIASAHAQRQDGVVRVDSHLTATPQ